MMTKRLLQIVRISLVVLLVMMLGSAAAQDEAETTPEAEDTDVEVTAEATAEAADTASAEGVVIMHEGLFPEGVEYDPVNERFLVSSVAEGTVYAVAGDGTTTPLVQDERITASIGIQVDEAGNRLLVAVGDMQTEAFLGAYDLTSGENLWFTDLTQVVSNDTYFPNDVAIDSQGNAYVTDSFAGVIYQVDPQGSGTVFLEHESFSTQFALNGIDYNAAGDYLVAVRVPGLIKIPVGNPAGMTPVEMDVEIPGEDGITFLDDGTLAIVSNIQGRVYRVESGDEFATAQLSGLFETGEVFPTTVAVRNGEAYVLHAYLNQQQTPRSEFPIQHVMFEDMTAAELMTPQATATP